MIDAAPIFTYFCPFSRSDMEKKYHVRSSPVTFGNTLVNDPAILTGLEQATGLESLMAGPHDWQMGGDDNVIKLEAVDPRSIEQLQTFLDLIVRTLDLLEQSKLIE
jgi:hypothetical protein